MNSFSITAELMDKIDIMEDLQYYKAEEQLAITSTFRMATISIITIMHDNARINYKAYPFGPSKKASLLTIIIFLLQVTRRVTPPMRVLSCYTKYFVGKQGLSVRSWK